jgi:hypothetical protein
MQYNSQRDQLIIPEYGRHVQGLVEHAKTIEDKTERQAFVNQLVELMFQMNPQSRILEDYKEKLWKHLFRISGYELDVETPDGVKIEKPEEKEPPKPLDYPEGQAKYRHYGHHVQTLIKKAIDMEDGPIKEAFVEVIGNYMKLAYRTWHKEHHVNDDIIKSDLVKMSQGKLKISEDSSLDNLKSSYRTTKPQRKGGRSSYSSSNTRGRSNNNRGRRRK